MAGIFRNSVMPEDRENQTAFHPKRQVKVGENSNQHGAIPKRQVLGNIANTANVRKQPTRIAKQAPVGDKENGGFLPDKQKCYDAQESSRPSFAIYQDKENDKPKSHLQQSKLQVVQKEKLNPLATELSHKPKLTTQLCQPSVKPRTLPSPIHDVENEKPKSALKPSVARELLPESPMVLDVSATESPSHKCVDKSKDDVVDIFSIPEYEKDIYKYLKGVETNHRPRPFYLKRQPDITQTMRSILVDWLVEVADEYKLQPETMYLAVSYIDRFLSTMSVLRSKLQLVGTAAMFIAAKYEEIYPPDATEFVYITDDTYTKRQVLRMEHLILKVLAFDLTPPTIFYFVNRFTSTSGASDKIKHLSLYLGELTLMEADPYLKFSQSQIAAAAVSIANYTLGLPAWDSTMEQESGIQWADLCEVVRLLYKTYRNAPAYPQQAIREKYKDKQYSYVSSIPAPPTCPC